MPEITATVVAKSQYGIKIEQDGDWLNWSKPEFRGEPFNTEVQKGDRVQITYAESDSGKVFITTIDKVTGPVQTASSGSDEPFPPDEEFASSSDIISDATSEPSEPVLDKEHSIVRQTCIKVAGMALQHGTGNAEEKAGAITYLAGVLEDWCWR